MGDWKYHCAVLGVAENTNLKDVRKAYKKLALKFHPDRNQNSVKAKEKFQQLNESFHYLEKTLQAGGPPKESPTPRPAPVAQVKKAQITPKRAEPLNLSSKAYLKILGHAAVACLVLTFISLVGREQAPPPKASTDYRDLAQHAWCNIDGASSFQTKIACRELCTQLNQPKARCSWDSGMFQGPELERPPTIARAQSTPNKVYSDPKPPKREITHALPAPALPQPEAPAAATAEAARAPEEFLATCFMTVVMPGNPRAETFANQSANSCAEICRKEIVAHPLQGEVQCAWAGEQLVYHVPDPMSSYLAGNKEVSGFQQGQDYVANCEIYAKSNGVRVQARAGLSSPAECQELCGREQINAARKAIDVTCAYSGKEFSRNPASLINK